MVTVADRFAQLRKQWEDRENRVEEAAIAKAKTRSPAYNRALASIARPVARTIGAFQQGGTLGGLAQTAGELTGGPAGRVDEQIAPTRAAEAASAERLGEVLPYFIGERGAEEIVKGKAPAPRVTELPETPARAQPLPAGMTEVDMMAPETGSFAMTLPKGNTYSTMPGWTAADQERLDQLKSEGYGYGFDPTEKLFMTPGPTPTSRWKREQEMKNARRGGPTPWELKRMDPVEAKLRMAGQQAEIDEVAGRFAAEDEAAGLRDVARMKADTAARPTLGDQIDVAGLGIDRQRLAMQQAEAKAGMAAQEARRAREEQESRAEEEDRFEKNIRQAMEDYALPVELETTVAAVASRAGDSPRKVARVLGDILRGKQDWAEKPADFGTEIQSELLARLRR